MIVLQLKNISKIFYLKKKRPFFFDFRTLFDVLIEGMIERKPKPKFVALDDVSIKIYEGEVVGIIGSNGAGKSTLIKIIYGILKPTSGEILCESKITALFGFGSCFNMELTGRDNIFLTATAYGLSQSRIYECIDQIIAYSEIEEIDIQMKFYSNGMKSRLGFSILLYIESDILILDEALTGGDAYFQKKSIQSLKDLIQTPNKTVILISHNEGMIRELCTRVILMKKGKVLLDSLPVSALEYYKQNYNH